ncbi:alpha/beta fold hydrolase [Nocardioides sp.]|uniref:alpha/beta fold hydrolase n=1 Tax=Nocardioides sp. TaxID=35761 RepID=UPI002723A564|nr:alpha/beta hydrolase [Nocardioides sp.]MDO9457528.1 alpha/beta hydrolase [Nocardioides sp.]
MTLHIDDPHRPDDVDTGTAILLVHGFGLSSRVWEPMRGFLDPRRRVVAVDTRGHGRSGAAASYTLTAMVDDLVGLIEALGLDRPLVVGSSLGAVAATELAHARPDLVGAAVLIGSMGHSMVVEPDFVAANRAMAAGLEVDVEATMAATVPGWFGVLGSPAVTSWAVREALLQQPGISAFVDSVTGWDPRPYLPRVGVPLHYLHGRHDPIPLEVVREDAALSPDATLTVAEHAGHMPHVESPGWTAGFVEQHARTLHAGRHGTDPIP